MTTRDITDDPTPATQRVLEEPRPEKHHPRRGLRIRSGLRAGESRSYTAGHFLLSLDGEPA